MVSLDPADFALAAAQAARRIRPIVRETPLEHSPGLSARTGARVWLKLENQQRTGSFKLRGAVNRLLTLSRDQLAAGCVTASSGNHAAGLAYAMRELDVDGVIFVPEHTSKAKLDAIRSLGGDVRLFGTDGLDTEQHARAYATDLGMFYVSPYNDPEIVAGQGSCGIEIIRQLPDVDAAFIAVGGGGLITGVGSVLKQHDPDIRVIGCQPLNSAVMARSVEAGRILDLPSEPTLSDGTAGGIEADTITFGPVRKLVTDFALVDEDAIAAGIRELIDTDHQLVEGAAAVALAAFLDRAEEYADKNVVILVCGGNISRATLERVLCRDGDRDADDE